MVVRIVTFGTSLTNGGGWQSNLVSWLATYGHLPGKTVEIVNRGMGGADSARGQRNIQRVIDDDPSVVLMEFAVNDAHTAKNVSVAQSQANHYSLMAQLRLAIPGVKIALQTTLDIRPPNTSIGDEWRYYNMYRYIHLTDTETTQGPDWLFDGSAFWWRVGDAHIPDGVHPTTHAWNTYITPRMARYLGPLLDTAEAAGSLRNVTSPTPPISWTPLP